MGKWDPYSSPGLLSKAKARQRIHFFLGGEVRDNFWGGFMAGMNISSSASRTHFSKPGLIVLPIGGDLLFESDFKGMLKHFYILILGI